MVVLISVSGFENISTTCFLIGCRFRGFISLNAITFTSVLLASRLQSSLHVFAFISFAFIMFAGFPLLVHSFQVSHRSLATLLCRCFPLSGMSVTHTLLHMKSCETGTNKCYAKCCVVLSRQLSSDVQFGVSGLLFSVALHFLLTISTTITVTYVTTILFVTFVCPLWLKFIQKYKK